jgi:hypothetical protein
LSAFSLDHVSEPCGDVLIRVQIRAHHASSWGQGSIHFEARITTMVRGRVRLGWVYFRVHRASAPVLIVECFLWVVVNLGWRTAAIEVYVWFLLIPLLLEQQPRAFRGHGRLQLPRIASVDCFSQLYSMVDRRGYTKSGSEYLVQRWCHSRLFSSPATREFAMVFQKADRSKG